MAGEVGGWLRNLGLGEYAEAFTSNKISFQHLPELSKGGLKELGVAPLGDRKLLARTIDALGSTRIDEAGPGGREASAKPAQGTDAERRQLTMMFCDLVDSTVLSQQLDPEDLLAVLRRYHDTVAGVVARFDGHVAKLLGDGVLALFGWPRAHEDQAESAVRAGLALTQAVRDLQKEVKQGLSA